MASKSGPFAVGAPRHPSDRRRGTITSGIDGSRHRGRRRSNQRACVGGGDAAPRAHPAAASVDAAREHGRQPACRPSADLRRRRVLRAFRAFRAHHRRTGHRQPDLRTRAIVEHVRFATDVLHTATGLAVILEITDLTGGGMAALVEAVREAVVNEPAVEVRDRPTREAGATTTIDSASRYSLRLRTSRSRLQMEGSSIGRNGWSQAGRND